MFGFDVEGIIQECNFFRGAFERFERVVDIARTNHYGGIMFKYSLLDGRVIRHQGRLGINECLGSVEIGYIL